MKCIVCNSEMKDYFYKDFNGDLNLNKVYYVKCIKCGFVASKTHYEMSQDKWEELNYNFNSRFLNSDNSPDDPKWKQRLIEHSIFLKDISSIIDGQWLDWGCGDGKLADMLSDKVDIYKYDKYTGYNCNLNIKYNLVINTAVLEHVRDRETIEEINRLVSDNGALAIHTKISRVVPKDPNWKYLLPVHCSFFTIDSMNILFDDWGYKTCIFYEYPVMWVFIKKDGIIFEHNGSVISNRFIG